VGRRSGKPRKTLAKSSERAQPQSRRHARRIDDLDEQLPRFGTPPFFPRQIGKTVLDHQARFRTPAARIMCTAAIAVFIEILLSGED
jgi:hypothetical protein